MSGDSGGIEHVRTRIDALLEAYAREYDPNDESGVLDRLLRTAADSDITSALRGTLGDDSAGPEQWEPLAELSRRFELDRPERDAVLLALAPDLDPRFGQALSRLHGERTVRRPTVDVVVNCLRATGSHEDDALAVFAPSSSLIRWGLLDLRERDVAAPYRDRIVGLDQRVLVHLLGADRPSTERAFTVATPPGDIDALPVGSQLRERLRSVADDAGERPTVTYCTGPDEAVLRRAVDAVCGTAGTDVVRVETRAVVDDTDLFERTVREALLRGAPVHLTEAAQAVAAGTDDPEGERTDRGDGRRLAALRTRLADFDGDVYVSGGEQWTPTARFPDREFRLLEFPEPGYEHRRRLWADRAGELPPDVTPTELAGTFELSQGDIERALATARALSGGDTIAREELYRSCKRQSSANLEAMAERIDPQYSWDDILLDDETERHLRDVAAHITERGTVYSEWGFQAQYARGIGVVALFSGPSGTGKTMAAEVLATHAGLDLYRVDLSTLVSKYVGETEANLERVFDEAERSSAILLFDEADAVFGERSEVSDSTDRYANVETNYLLQRIERHDGVVILTTNYSSNIDDAFRRRIHRRVEFALPDQHTRERLWRELFPDETPTNGLDWTFLAQFELSGGAIRNAVQTAAFRAARADGPVEMSHVVPALQRELEKSGGLVDPSQLGEYRSQFEDL